MTSSNDGISSNRKYAKAAATTGWQSLLAEINAGDMNLRHQLKMECPRKVENKHSSSPTQTADEPSLRR